jgi:hypothetical protein
MGRWGVNNTKFVTFIWVRAGGLAASVKGVFSMANVRCPDKKDTRRLQLVSFFHLSFPASKVAGDQNSIPGRVGKDFFLFSTVSRPALEPTNLRSNGYRGSFPTVKPAGS